MFFVERSTKHSTETMNTHLKNAIVFIDELPQNFFKKRYNHITSFLRLQIANECVSFSNENEEKQVRVKLQGKFYNITVKPMCKVDNESPLMITLDTQFLFENKVSQNNTMNDTMTIQQQNTTTTLGGLKREKLELENIMNTFFSGEENTIIHSAGILVHGMAGTGKTTLVNHMINELKQNAKIQLIMSVHAWQFSSQIFGENEQKLRGYLLQAKQNTPCVIVMDGIHYLAPNMQNSSLSTSVSVSSNPTRKRLLNTLLSILDEVKEWNEQSGEKGKILVVGITNQMGRIDSRIRRAGRLDNSVEFSVPTQDDRTEIIQSIMNNEANNGKFELELAEKISEITHGFVISDLKALCNEATLQSIIESQQNSENQQPPTIQFKHFQQAQAHVKPSAIREVLVEVPKVKWTDIGGQEEVKQSLKEAVEWQFKHADAFKRMNIRPPRGILLYGPPGCSKTLMAKALATEANLNFLAVRGPELFSKWVGESERAVREVFRKARAAAPSIIFFDEIDGLGVERGSSGQAGVGDRVLSQLLNELDGIDPLQGVTVVAATNRPDILDKALLRPGRIDRMLYVSPPDVPSRKEILSIQLRRMAHNLDQTQVQHLAEITEGYSGAEIAALAREAAYKALRQDIHALQVQYIHFEQALESVKPRISKQMIHFYQTFANKITS
jgi:SpoVK/Ycf46/Vps4 family AAA+-type ATPase